MSLQAVHEELGQANMHMTGALLAVGELEIDDIPTEVRGRLVDAQAAVVRAGTLVAKQLERERAQ